MAERIFVAATQIFVTVTNIFVMAAHIFVMNAPIFGAGENFFGMDTYCSGKPEFRLEPLEYSLIRTKQISARG